LAGRWPASRPAPPADDPPRDRRAAGWKPRSRIRTPRWPTSFPTGPAPGSTDRPPPRPGRPPLHRAEPAALLEQGDLPPDARGRDGQRRATAERGVEVAVEALVALGVALADVTGELDPGELLAVVAAVGRRLPGDRPRRDRGRVEVLPPELAVAAGQAPL